MARHAPLTPYVAPITTAGAAVTMTDAGNATLSSGTTYYYPLGNPSQKLLNEVAAAPLEFVQIQWDANAILTITYEDTCWSVADVTSYSSTAGDWIKEDPSTAYVAVLTGSATVLNMTISVAGGTAGGATIHLGNFGAPRARLKVVVGVAGGVVRVGQHGKA